VNPKRIALVTDAWKPQTNGVAITLGRLTKHLESKGVKVLVVAPDAHRTVAMPSYPEIRMAWDPWRAINRIRAFEPEAIHVATEGPLGIWASHWMSRNGLRFTTSFHTRYPEYVNARFPVPLPWLYSLERWFHNRAERTLVSSKALLKELQAKRLGKQLVHWPRGVDASLFTPERRNSEVYPGAGPVWLYVGRVAVEKSLEDFLRLPLPGSKVVVGDGPSRADLQARYPDVIWRGYRFGEDLAAHFASADCFVFPSRTETFGNVILEAMASGLPVASVPAPGPVDLIVDGVTGAVSEDLLDACNRAILCSRAQSRAKALGHTFIASHDCFYNNLVPLASAAEWVGMPAAAAG